jgi:hypothetical protein
LDKRRNAGEALDTTFLSCANPRKLQEICDSIGPEDTDGVFRKMAEAPAAAFAPQGLPGCQAALPTAGASSQTVEDADLMSERHVLQLQSGARFHGRLRSRRQEHHAPGHPSSQFAD